MKINEKYLPVYNELYDIGLSEENIEIFTAHAEEWVSRGVEYKKKSGNSYLSIERAGWKHNIRLTPLDEFDDPDSLKSDIYQLAGIKDKGYFEENPLELDIPTEILLEILQPASVDKDRKLDNKINYYKKKFKEFFVNQSFRRISYHFWSRFISDEKDLEELVKHIHDIEINLNKNYDPDDLDSICWRFVSVEGNGKVRVAKAQKRDPMWRSSLDEMYLIVSADHPAYDYIDEGRFFFTIDSSKLPRMYLLMDIDDLPSQKAIYRNILENRNEEAFLIGEQDLKSEVRRIRLKEKSREKKKERKDKLRERFSKKLNSEKEVSINGIDIKDHSIEYAGQKVHCDDIDMKKVVKRYGDWWDVHKMSWDEIFEGFTIYVQNEIDVQESIEFKGELGDVEFVVENRVKTNKNGRKYRLVYINDYLVKRDETSEILERGLCFSEQEDFDDFVHSVSKCSLKIHRFLNKGIHVGVWDQYRDSRIKVKLPLVRKSGVNYLVIGDKEFRVSDTNKLVEIENYNSMDLIINTLLNPDIIKIDGASDIGYIIKKGQELSEKEKKENRERINKVEEMFDLELESMKINGEQFRGYNINDKYFLDVGQTDKEQMFDRLTAYTYPDMHLVCLIDKSVHQTGVSQLISRIYALNNDQLIAENVENQLNN